MAEKWATELGTEKYFQWISVHVSKQRRFDRLTVSALGAGTYLGPPDDATDKLYSQTLLQAGLGGINFFDTAINYRNQRSERVLGKVIRELAGRGILRDQLVIATKGGFLPTDGEEPLEDYVRTHYLDTGIVEEKEIVAGAHCMSPAYLDNQIASSLKNLGIACIDLYYLHNPETQFAEVNEEEFYRRLTASFKLFEQKVQEKKIGRYGLATWNGFRQKKGGLQLAKVIQCAREAGGEGHHLKAIQLPYNLVMLEAIKQKKTFIQAAKEYGIAVMVSAPLMQAQVGQLCKRVFEKLPPGKSPQAQSLEFVLSTPNICTAFCGMKKGEHWEANKTILQDPIWSPDLWAKATLSLGIEV